jgi:SpoVK/Ycf46/Vps4 family AAA+-type ATPase
LFFVAAKVAPIVIFIDEVDSILVRQGSNYEHGTMRRISNEFMFHWDGLLSKPDERIIVLDATNMPFNLDEQL